MWGVLIIALGLIGIALVNFFGQVSTTNDQTYYLLKETTEAAMIDSVDLIAYRYGYTDKEGKFYEPGVVKIDEEKFVEMFTRRYAESAEIRRKYKISFYDIDELPPKVVIKVESGEKLGMLRNVLEMDQEYEFSISNSVAAILEEKVEE